MYRERAAIRHRDRGYPLSKAELLAWRELECRWHMAHCEAPAAGVCAGCRQPIGTEIVIVMIDGNRCHDRAGHACLILAQCGDGSVGCAWFAAAGKRGLSNVPDSPNGVGVVQIDDSSPRSLRRVSPDR
jgi:hypothetical protein